MAIAAVAVLTGAGAPAGCKARAAYQGSDRSVMAAYGLRKLRTELPPTVRVPAVVAAADAALRDRGYAVTSSHASEDAGRVEGEPRGAGVLESVVVSARLVADSTRVEVVIKPWGDEPKSRAILDAILIRLGL